MNSKKLPQTQNSFSPPNIEYSSTVKLIDLPLVSLKKSMAIRILNEYFSTQKRYLVKL